VGVLRTVTAPLLAPGLAAGLALVFLAGLKEVPATLLVAPLGFETLATQAFGAAQRGSDAGMAFPSLLIVALAAAGTALLIVRGARTPVVDS
jgi:iron(III) transport system permease protein